MRLGLGIGLDIARKIGGAITPVITWFWGTATGSNWGTLSNRGWGVPTSATAPANITPPSITGTAVVDQTLTINGGTWNAVPYILRYDIYRDTTLITSIATSSSSINYTIPALFAGSNLKCTVTATNSAGSASADSNTLSILATLLDIQSGGVVNYSLKLLRGAYINSAAIRLRRSSDNAEVDVYFDSSYKVSLSSNINSINSGTSLSTWIGSNTGYVVTWYDQSLNGANLTQSTPANQPILINAGILQTQNSEATIVFNATNFLQVNPSWNNTFSIYSILKFDNTSTLQVPFRDNGASNSTAIVGYPTPNLAFYRVRTTTLNISTDLATEFGTTRKLSTMSSNSSNVGEVFINNVSRGSLSISGSVGTTMYVGVNGVTPSQGLIGNIQTFNIFSNTNVSSINGTLNSIYNVY